MAEKLTRFVTPRGTAIYPHLHAPDTKFVAEGVYTTKLRMDHADGEAFLTKLQAEIRKAEKLIPSAVQSSKKKAVLHESWEEMEDGSFVFNTKAKASGITKDGRKWERKLPLYDAKGVALPEGTRVGGGSILKLAVEVFPYYNASDRKYGVALWLTAVQVIDLKTFGASSADAFGFEEEDGFDSSEGGFPVDAAEDAEDTPADDAEADEDDDDSEF